MDNDCSPGSEGVPSRQHAFRVRKGWGGQRTLDQEIHVNVSVPTGGQRGKHYRANQVQGVGTFHAKDLAEVQGEHISGQRRCVWTDKRFEGGGLRARRRGIVYQGGTGLRWYVRMRAAAANSRIDGYERMYGIVEYWVVSI